MASDELLRGQVEYYRARASEYDEYYLRTGPFDLGPEGNAEWSGELAAVSEWLAAAPLDGSVLELAAGTGWWTGQLVRPDNRVVAVDAAPEMLAINRSRNVNAGVELVLGDVFGLDPGGRFDTIFFGFWLSHVPADRFDEFWDRLAGWLRPGGQVLVVDNLTSSAPWIQERPADQPGTELITRRLNDGRTFTIVKTYWTPESLGAALAPLGWTVDVRTSAKYFAYGTATPL